MDELLEALKQLLESYLFLVNSGDCGQWDPEEDECVIKARSVLSKVENA